MRATLLSLLTVLLMGAAGPMAQAFDQNQAALVDSWYQRFLGRNAEPYGLATHAERLCAGMPVEVVEAGILVSEEYYHRNGCNDPQFVAALFRDVAGINATPHQVNHALRRLYDLRNREAFTIEFLRTHGRPSAPVVQTYRPTYAAPVPVAVPYPTYRPTYNVAPQPFGVRPLAPVYGFNR